MPNTRSFLIIALLFVGYLLWQQWQLDYGPRPGNSPTTLSAPAVTEKPGVSTLATPSADVPTAPANNTSALSPAAAGQPTTVNFASRGQLIEVTTDLLKLVIDTRGGNIVRADLLAYPMEPKDFTHPVRLLDDSAIHYFVAQSGWVSSSSPAPDHQAQFQAENTQYSFDANSNTLEVPLTWTDGAGLKIQKTFIFKRGSYEVEQREEINNGTPTVWTGNEYHQLQRVPPIIASSGFSITNPEKSSFTGAAWYSPEKKFEKLAFDKFGSSPLSREITNGWATMVQHYFLAAWIPPPGEMDHYSTALIATADTAPHYLIRTLSPIFTVKPGEVRQTNARLYIGPKIQSQLAAVAPGFELTIDYGIFTIIAQPLFTYVLSPLHTLTGNWGWAIILVTLLIKLVFFKLSEAQYRSMAKMRKFQPRLEALKERYADDKQKLQQAMLELYKKEKINPMGGCLPMLVQIPVFIALYWVLIESVELRHAPFIFWIKNLSAPDPYFVLPVLNGLAMIATQYLSPTAGVDPVQAKIMKIMPMIFAVMFAFFPAGLVLYWTVNGTLSLIQQWVITKRIEGATKA